MNVQTLLSSLNESGYTIACIHLSLLWQSSFLIGAFGLIACLLRRRSAALPHRIVAAAVFMTPLIPLLSWIIATTDAPRTEFRVLPSIEVVERAVKSPIQNEVPVPTAHTESQVTIPDKQHEMNPPVPDLSYQAPLQTFSLLDYPWAWVLLLYALLALFMLFLVISGRMRVYNWIHTGTPVIDDRTITACEILRRKIGIGRYISIVESPHAAVPMAVGLRTPVILLPENFANSLTNTELNAVLVHELTHIRRHDATVMTLTAFIRAVLFYHPLIWVAMRQMSVFAEESCDRAVLDITEEPLVYARLLSRFAEQLHFSMLRSECVAGIIVSKHVLLRRVKSVLSGHVGLNKLSKVALGCTALSAIAAVVFALSIPLTARNNVNETVVITGRVTSSSGPVEGADIFLHSIDDCFFAVPQYQHMTVSDREGNFTFTIPDSLRLHRPVVVVVQDSYAPGIRLLEELSDITTIAVHLEKPSILSGYALDRERNPIRGAVVTTSAMQFHQNGRTYSLGGLMPGIQAVSDEEGHYQINNLPENTPCNLEINKEGYAAHPFRDMSANETTRPNGIIGISSYLSQERIIEGRVVYDESGDPASYVKLILLSRNVQPHKHITTTTDAKGYFVFYGFSDGSYTLILDWRNASDAWAAQLPEQFNLKTLGKYEFDIRLTRGSVLSGRITDMDSMPMQGVDVALHDQKTIVTTDKDGTYRIHSLPGEANLSISVPYGYSLATQDLQSITVGMNDSIEGIDFKLTKDHKKTHIIRGRVVDTEGKPIQNAMVKLNIGLISDTPQVITNVDGRFSIQTHREVVNAQLQIVAGSYGSYTFYTSTGMKDEYVLMKAPYYFSGRLVSANKEDIVGARIKILDVELPDECDTWPLFPGMTREGGWFSVGSLPDSMVTVQFSQEGLGTKTFENIDVTKGQYLMKWNQNNRTN